MTADEFFAIGLALPLVKEARQDGARVLRIRGKVAATVSPDGGLACLKLTRAMQDEILPAIEAAFYARGRWGRLGWTDVNLAALGQRDARDLLELAWMAAVPMRHWHMLDEEDA